jgi:dTDP-4-dehydrorhamnose reductase
MKKLLVTGGGGFVAGNIIRESLGGPFAIHAVELKELPYRQDNLVWHSADLLDPGRLKELFYRASPEVVVHTAAASDIDFCEAHPREARQLNTRVTRVLVDLCSQRQCRLIYFSSDSVFDGERGNYAEGDAPRPLNVYARTKVASETIVRKSLDNWVVVRPSLVLGMPAMGGGNSFLQRMIRSLEEGREVAFPREEIRSPVDVITLSRAVLELAGNDYRGFLHLSGNDALSRYDMARRLTRKLGYSVDRVVDSKPLVHSGRARRPRDVSLCNLLAGEVLATPMRNLEEAMDLALADREGKGS